MICHKHDFRKSIIVIQNDLFPFLTMNIQLKESRIEVPSTSIAAHIFDEEVEIELDDRTDINETSNTQYQNGVAFGVKGVPLMLPPPLVPHSNYSQVSSSLGYLFFSALRR